MKALIVTGCGRSGTTYLATVLRTAGLPATHEMGPDDPRVTPPSGIDVNWLAVGWLPVHDAVVIHLVRHPLDVVASCQARGFLDTPSPYGRWAMMQMPAIRAEKGIARSLRYCRDWNHVAERHADARWRVEDLSASQIAAALETSGYRVPAEHLADALAATGTTVNTDGPRPSLMWKDLPRTPLARDVHTMAEEYGYR